MGDAVVLFYGDGVIMGQVLAPHCQGAELTCWCWLHPGLTAQDSVLLWDLTEVDFPTTSVKVILYICFLLTFVNMELATMFEHQHFSS